MPDLPDLPRRKRGRPSKLSQIVESGQNVKDCLIPAKKDHRTVDYETIISQLIELKAENPKLEISAFAKDRGIHPETFRGYLWRHPEIMDRIRDEIRRRYAIHGVDIDHALIEKSKKGDPRAMELFYRRHENWNVQGNQGLGNITLIFAQSILPGDQRAGGDKVIEFRGKKDAPIDVLVDTEGVDT